MESIVQEVALYVSLSIELIAIAVIGIGALVAVIGIANLRTQATTISADRLVWRKFARWLVAGMTFQLAADIVSTSVAPTWDQVGHVAAIAGIRTFLSFFLDREMEDRNKLEKSGGDPV
jgi:uncharacterized membrane protein